MKKRQFSGHSCFMFVLPWRVFGIMLLVLFVGNHGLRADTIVEKTKLNISVKNASMLEIFSLIKQQTVFSFVYNDRDISQVKPKNIQVKDADIITVLNKCIEGTDLTYEFVGNAVIFKRTEAVAKDSVKALLIKGSVKDEKGFPLPGVTVVLKSTQIGVVTDMDGLFKLTFSLKDTSTILVFSFIGMESKEVKIGSKREFNIVLKEKSTNLEDVVVTGYANISRQSFTGNVKTITATELKKISPTNILKSLQVLDPSFRIAVNNEMGSNPNALPNISIRGTSGIGITQLDATNVSKTALENDPNLPTFILDGFEVSATKLFDMDVNRIESITLLKDAAATAIYGSRAANGVVVITTIAPKEGEIRVNYNYDLNLQVPDLRDYNLMNAGEKVEAEKAAGLFDKDVKGVIYYNEKLRMIESGHETDWISKPLRNAANSKHYLRVEGGSKELRYGIDVNYFGDKGVMKGSERKRVGIGFELQYNVGKLIFKNVAEYNGVHSEDSPYGNFSQYSQKNPYYAYQDENGVLLKKLKDPNESMTVLNPLYEATLGNYNQSKRKMFSDNFSVQYYVTSKLFLKGNIALTYTTTNSESYTSPESQVYVSTTYKGEMTIGNTSATNIDGGLFAYYNNTINGHSFNVVVGVNMKESSDENFDVSVKDLPRGFSAPQFARSFPKAPNAQEQTNRLFGAMASMNYTYNNVYLADLTGRLDGNSSFGSDKRFAPFWSAGVGINIHNYSFMKSVSWLSELKLRGSYGITGKANFPAKTARTVYELNQESIYPTGVGANISAMGNRQLKWERTKITDVGATIGLFNNVLYLNGTYYFRRTVDLIADMYIPSSSGFISYKENVGEITNDGYELTARVKVISNSNLQLFFAGSIAGNKNRIEKVSDALKSYNKMIEDSYKTIQNGANKPLVKFVEGASTSAIYAMQSLGIDPQTGKELFVYRDGTVSTEWLGAENIALGDTEPKLNGNFSMNLNYKGITLDAYFVYTSGGQQYNQTLQTKIENANLNYNADRRVLTDRWKNPGDIAGFKSLKDYDEATKPTSRFIQDEKTLTLQAVSLGYELPRSLLSKTFLNQVRFSFNMNDVFRFSTIEQERGLSYPFARGYSFSVNVGF